jgi:hypothetical protein
MTHPTNPSSPDRRSIQLRILPFAWLALSASWAVVVFVTDRPAWPLAIWVAGTLGPLAAVERRHRLHPGSGRNDGS